MRARTLLLSLALFAPAGAALAQSAPPPPTTVEKIPLHYIDVRVLTTAFGAPVLPTEWDLYRMRMGGGFGGFGGLGMPGGVQGGGYGAFGNFGMIGDPNTNSLLVGPGWRGGMAPGMGTRGRAGNGAGGYLFGDPGSNSLLGGFRSAQPQR